MWVQIFPSVKTLMELFKRLVGKLEGDPIGYSRMRLSVWQKIWIPQNESERVKIEIDQVVARVKSRKAAMQDIGNSYKGDYEQIKEEWEDEIRMKAEIPAEAKAKYATTGDESGGDEEGKSDDTVDNRLPGKSITE